MTTHVRSSVCKIIPKSNPQDAVFELQLHVVV